MSSYQYFILTMENEERTEKTGDKYRKAQSLVVEILNLNPQDEDAAKVFKLWKRKLEIYLQTLEASNVEKFNILINRLGLNAYDYVDSASDYDEAIEKLEKIYSKKINRIYARWKLSQEKQREGESIANFVNRLMIIAKDCGFEDVTAVEYKKESVLQSFIAGLEDPYIRQRILEKDVDLEGALEAAEILKRAKTDANSYETEKHQATVAVVSAANSKCDLSPESTEDSGALVDHIAAVSKTFKASNTKLIKCQNCGVPHPVRKCPAFGKTCFNCGKLNHFAEFCRKTKQTSLNSLITALENSTSVLCKAGVLRPSLINIEINGRHLSGLLDTGASDCFMTTKLAKRLGLKINNVFDGKVALADKDLKSKIMGKARADLVLGNEKFLCKNVEFTLLNNLVKDVIIGLKVLKKHKSITLDFDGNNRPLNFKHESESNLSVMCSNVRFPTLFPGINNNTEPIKMPSRKYSKEERSFNKKEIIRLLENDIIEESISPWRSQCLVVKQKGDKWRLCIDYSQSVNRYTELDAFPLPRIDELVNELSKHHFFSKYDLKNAYHQIPLHPDDKKLTAFEANGKLLQFKRIPFGLTNAVGAFQRTVTQIIKEDGLVGVYPYLDDVSVAGNTLEELRDRSMKFESALKKRKMTLNEDKTVREVKKMTVLG